MKRFVLLFFIVTLIFSCSSGGDDSSSPDPKTNGVSVAVNDNLATDEDTALIISNLLSNDTVLDNAKITSFDATSINGGTIMDNRDGTYTFTPAAGFLGEDTFTYTICDRDTPPDCSTATVTITVADGGDPVAVNDNFTSIEDTDLIVENLLSNDTVLDNARITSFDDVSINGGTIVDNGNNTFNYSPFKAFVGEDTFTYTICDNDTPNNTCSTATVTITVNDEGSPVAMDDTAATTENKSITIDTVLDNDILTDDATLFSIDNASTSGNVVLEGDGTITYTPANDFLGDDSFTYTICDDDTPNATCVSATVTISVLEGINFNIPAELVNYYDGVAFFNNQDLMFTALESLTQSKHTTILSYGQRHNYLYNADEDMANTDNVILMYSGESRYWEEYTSGSNSYNPQTFNTEHVFPQSRLSSNDAVTDLHHLRACDSDVNEERSNFGFIDGIGGYKLVGNKWYPGDDWRGDVARMILYLSIRYGEDYTKMASLDLFLAWNIADPVSDFEEQRNNVIEGAQGNRNPFIDNPYLITLIWGGDAAENKWE